jgi:CheY-like chemotaxis protein
MPEMNGFEATKHIRDNMNSHIPIVALTADVTTADLRKCKVVGMNDYISKPIDEKLLYSKIINLIKNPICMKNTVITASESKCTDLTYLNDRTKADPALMMDMIALYLEQTPPLISTMKLGVLDNDWNSIYTAVHKIIPSFYIMGIHKDFEDMGKKIQEYATKQQHIDEVQDLVLQLENVCSQACLELKEAYDMIKKNNR